MVLNYLKIVFRNLLRSKLFSFINIGGLAIGLCSCVFIMYYINEELSFDRFHEKADRIYRITTNFIDPHNTNRMRFTDQKIGPYLKRLYPQVEEIVRMDGFGATFQLGNEAVGESNIIAADPSVFNIFTYPLIAGNPKNVFEKKNSIVLSESLAKKYFEKEAFGKTLTINNELYEVTGIMEDIPVNSDKWVNGLVYGAFPGEEYYETQIKFDTYVLLKSAFNVLEFQSILDKAAASIWKQDISHPGVTYEFQKLTDLHFTQGIQWDQTKGNKNNVYIFLTVAFILFVVVVFNFINLTTVKSLERAKEVGVRKLSGATHNQLVSQFLGEAFITTFLAGALASVLTIVFYSVFYTITGKSIHFSSQSDIVVILGSILLLIFLAIVSSIYPAWVLSSFKPVVVLKGSFSHRPKGNFIRNIFIIGQFGLSTSLLVFLMVVSAQMNWMGLSDLGFNKNDVLVADIPDGISFSYIKNELQKSTGVLKVSSGGYNSLPGGNTETTPIWYNQFGSEHEIQAQRVEADVDYPELLQLQLVKGKPVKSFPESQWSDLALINETFAHQIGWDDPIGRQIQTFSFDGRKKITIVGVLHDFHFKSLHNLIDPIIYFAVPPGGKHLTIRFLPEHLEDIKTEINKLLPDHIINYWFLNASFDGAYQAEETLITLLICFACLTVLLAGLGLYGLTAYTVETRIKEIGIRMVLGANYLSIMSLLSRTFVILVLIGSLIGSSIATYFSFNWLNSFTYKIELTWQLIIPLLVINLLSLFIITYRTYWTVQSNPIISLKYE